MNRTPSVFFCCSTIVFGLLLGSLMGPFLRFTLSHPFGLNVQNILFYRMLFTSLLLWAFCLGNASARACLARVLKNGRTLLCLVVLGLSRALELLLWAVALRDSNVFVVNVLSNSAPLFILLSTFFLYGQKTSAKALMGVALSMLGLIITSLSHGVGGASLTSVVQMTAVALLQTVFLLVSQPLRHQEPPLPAMVIMAFVFSIAAVFSLFFCLFTSTPLGPFPWQGWGMLAVMTVFCTIYHQTVPVWALKYVKPAAVSMLNLAGPLIAALVAFVLLGEVPSLQTCIGGVIALAGLGLYIWQDSQKQAA